ncbi:hypothetical protein MAR_035202 [Mya arenaria]|uniref:Uncharacterized protein n=1 Tax=Mya arenaria TaxID=6604 RepID=A0ABY7EMU0_MYAAR|nr:hypothetical protein MAR_035202 [Mya arenaria]
MVLISLRFLATGALFNPGLPLINSLSCVTHVTDVICKRMRRSIERLPAIRRIE